MLLKSFKKEFISQILGYKFQKLGQIATPAAAVKLEVPEKGPKKLTPGSVDLQ